METVVINGKTFRKAGVRGHPDSEDHVVALEEVPACRKCSRRGFLALAMLPFAVFDQIKRHEQDGQD
jgi:hypothetical protein